MNILLEFYEKLQECKSFKHIYEYKRHRLAPITYGTIPVREQDSSW